MSDRLTLAEIYALDAALDGAVGPGHPASALKPGTTSANGAAVAGFEGHLYIGQGGNLWERQYCGELNIPPVWLETWSDLFARRRAEAKARGLTVVNFVAPEKQAVLPEMRWPQGMEGAARRPLRRLIEALGPDALVYPDDAIAAVKPAAPVYFRHNSHWTPSGCIAAAQALWSHLEVEARAANMSFAIDRKPFQQDLAAHFFVDPPDEELMVLAPLGRETDNNRRLETTGQREGASYRLINPAAPDPRRLMLFGDSYAYGNGLSHALSAVFAQVTFLWSKSILWDATANADIVVWETAERFLATLPEH